MKNILGCMYSRICSVRLCSKSCLMWQFHWLPRLIQSTVQPGFDERKIWIAFTLVAAEMFDQWWEEGICSVEQPGAIEAFLPPSTKPSLASSYSSFAWGWEPVYLSLATASLHWWLPVSKYAGCEWVGSFAGLVNRGSCIRAGAHFGVIFGQSMSTVC